MWKDFDKIILSELVDEKNYLLRHKNSEDDWSCPYVGWWDAEDSQFWLLEATRSYKIEVDQVMEIPE